MVIVIVVVVVAIVFAIVAVVYSRCIATPWVHCFSASAQCLGDSIVRHFRTPYRARVHHLRSHGFSIDIVIISVCSIVIVAVTVIIIVSVMVIFMCIDLLMMTTTRTMKDVDDAREGDDGDDCDEELLGRRTTTSAIIIIVIIVIAVVVVIFVSAAVVAFAAPFSLRGCSVAVRVDWVLPSARWTLIARARPSGPCCMSF